MLITSFNIWVVLLVLVFAFTLVMVVQKKWLDFFYGLCLLSVMNLTIRNSIGRQATFSKSIETGVQILIFVILFAYVIYQIYKRKKQLN